MSREQIYSVRLRAEPEGGFTARVPAFPEIVTFGADEAKALAMAKESVERSLERRFGEGIDPPAPVDTKPAPDDTKIEQVTVLVRLEPVAISKPACRQIFPFDHEALASWSATMSAGMLRSLKGAASITSPASAPLVSG